MLTEFDVIERFFTRPRQTPYAPSIMLGTGDDCALLNLAPNHHLAVSTDMLVAGRHFFADTDPRGLGHKALAVNLSDLAAMGATPRAFTLALALPEARAQWLAPFSEGLFALADQYDCELIGGDTTAGPLNLCLTVFGEVKHGQALTRAAACVGDDIWVSGVLGDARLALGALRQEWTVTTHDWPALQRALEWPQPRIALGQALTGIAHAALDLSDGLAGDLMHLVKRSKVNAIIEVDQLPRSAILEKQPLTIQQRCTLSGGDDYELCFTAPTNSRGALAALAENLGLPLTRIGTITAFDPSKAQILWHTTNNTPLCAPLRGFDHFDTHVS
ncbi:thiamine-phosphate kinase [Mycoavidus sp. HKI]|uniref:thiamine-phosphate kinase n=1 Tax=Mycoavidus sp. HKI TaxID=2840467 RepID=UPI001CC158EF|nr:thiamine-phosphate kinase [Mycoavidus sp. HKI]UAW64234.1 thiamine-phosphate kinase [Mycoavidus sp. HKI]